MSDIAANPTYQAYAAARSAILTGASKRIPAASAGSQARALGLWDGKNPAVASDAQFALLLDLGIFAPVAEHRPALEREVRMSAAAPGSEAALVLEALQHTRITLFRVAGPHPAGGVWVDDLLRGMPVHLWDAGLARPGQEGTGFGGRLIPFDGFEMTCGVLAPLSDGVIDALLGFPQPEGPLPTAMPLLTPPAAEDIATLREAAKRPDFLLKLYRAALASGLMGELPKR